MLHDISPPLGPDIAVWPGDTPLSREVLLDLARGDSVLLSTLKSTVHLGAHADAPNHYALGGADISSCPLEPYLGPCQVIRVSVRRGDRVTPAMLPAEITEKRVLIATGTFPDPRQFNRDFAALSPELIDALHGRGVILVGLDSPSVDLFDSKDLPTHHRLLDYGMANLEGLMLEGVEPGRYELIALPLRLEGFDASPVRAVLRNL